MRAEVKRVNRKQGGGDRVIGSTDFKSFYPKLPVRRTAAIVGRMAELSDLDIKTDTTEMGLFLASTMTREEVVAMGLGEVVQERLYNKAAAPGITSREILDRGPTCGSKWRPPRRAPTEQERRRMLGKMLELSIIYCMEHHYYMLGGEVKRQARGAGIGLRCSEALGRAFGLDWDRRLVERLEALGWPPLMIQRYVDDLNAVLSKLEPGVRYNHQEGKLEVQEELVEEDTRREGDERTMAVFGQIANSIDLDMEVEVDYPTKHASRWMPILDMQMTMGANNQVVYMFYRKPMCSRYTMLANSAVSDRVKRTTMTNEALRRLLCCSKDLEEVKRVEVMEDYARLLKRSGYSERFRHEVISDALRGHQKLLHGEATGGRPVDRPRSFQEVERRRRRRDKGDRWYRREARGTNKKEGIFIVPPTPGGLLAKTLRRICQEELKGTSISMGVTERGGRRLGQELGCTVPGRSTREHCGREKCFPCGTGMVGVCRRTGLGYQIDCVVCGETGVVSRYSGETGKNMFMRGCNYVYDFERRKVNSPLWKHILEKHGGEMENTMFTHFKMELVKVFSKPQRRKADEGVRIHHLDPDTRMNSKDEYLQGTNLFLQPMRGVGII